MSIDVDELISGCLNNDRRCQKRLYDEFSPALFAVCRRYSGSEAEAEDILVDGFMSIFRNLHTFRRESQLFTWMKAIMVKTAVDHFRKSKKHLENLPIEENIADNAAADFATDLNNKIDARQILAIVEQMPDEWRTIFNLRILEEYSFKEIAEQLEKNENTVRVYFLRAKAWLAEKMKKEKM